MKSLLALASTLALSASAQKAPSWPPSSTWYSVEHQGYPYKWRYISSIDATSIVNYPRNYVELSRDRDFWCNQVLTRQVQGDIRGKTITVTFTVMVAASGSQWYFNGYQKPADYGTRPVDVRLFMVGYDALYAQVSSFTPNLPDLTQWGRTAFTLPAQAGSYTYTLTAKSDDATAWTNVNGQAGTAAICASNVKQIGLCLSGGRWYSVGVGAPASAGASITINSFSVQ